VALGDLELGAQRHRKTDLGTVVRHDADPAAGVLVLDPDGPGRLRQLGLALRGAGLEELDDAGHR